MSEESIDLNMLSKLVQELTLAIRQIEAETAARFDRLETSIAVVDGRLVELAVKISEIKHQLEL